MAQSGEEIRQFRLKKLELLRESGINPYPERSSFALTEIFTVSENFKKFASSKKSFGIGGRVMAKREHGGSTFLDVFDGTSKIQVFLGKDKLGEDSYALFLNAIDTGDLVAFWGKAFYTKREEPTVEVSKWEMLTKSLRPLPEKWHGLQDVEERFRKRYLDILMNSEVKEKFLLRSRLVQDLRNLLDDADFVEAETPILQPLYGGALAEPFKTRHRMLDMDMYLRIAPELYLKRLLVAGFNKIYEIGKNFRNEGLDATHNPEFTIVELYEAYKDAEYLRNWILGILENLIKKALGKTTFKFNEETIKFSKKAVTIKFWALLERYA